MPGEFVGMEIATAVVTASIVLAGILIGVGRAFSYKRIENFGIEEFIQSIINAAIIGAFAAIIGLINTVSSSVVEETCGTGTVIEQLSCVMSGTSTALFSLFQETVKLSNTIGYYQSLNLDFTFFSVQPFANLSAFSLIFSMQLLVLQFLIVFVELNVQVLSFIGQNALLLLFPIGLVFRTFFATRRLGGFLIGLAIGAYLLYPSFIMIFPDPQADVGNATANVTAFNDKSFYATMPIVDLNDNNAIAAKLDIMSGRCFGSTSPACANATIGLREEDVDFSGDLTVVTQKNSVAISKVLLYLVVAPLFSLIITIIFVKEITRVLGSEIGLDVMKTV
ncbi:hypothetical protein H0O02_03280 [Candidatus Micrarchaeota archaeon]|nr:hypothetical protein [Candidatus Micrarchaeota archaeon]